MDKGNFSKEHLFVLKNNNISELFGIQKKFMKWRREKNNLLVSAETTSGKTLVAEFMMSEVFHESSDVIVLYVAPLLELIKEKKDDLDYFRSIGVQITDQVHNIRPGRCLFLTTPEMVWSMFKKIELIERLKLVILDEIHLLSDGSRGAMFEMFIAYLKYLSTASIVALSATISNTDKLCEWLDADLIHHEGRSVELKEEFITIDTGDKRDKLLEIIDLYPDHQIIIFDSQRRYVESRVKVLIDHIPICTPNIVQKYPILDSSLPKTVFLSSAMEHGIGFHHAGLRSEEKSLVIEEFKNGRLRILVATTSLSMGVNLPADVVILYSLRIGTGTMKYWQYKQAVGRAGRYRYSDRGYAYILRKEDEPNFKDEQLPPVRSVLYSQGNWDRYILNLLLSLSEDHSLYRSEIANIFKKTFFMYNKQNSSLSKNGMKFFLKSIRGKIDQTVMDLHSNFAINIEDDMIIPTYLGRWIGSLYIDPILASNLIIFVLNNHLSLFNPTIEVLYRVTSALNISIRVNGNMWKRRLPKYLKENSAFKYRSKLLILPALLHYYINSMSRMDDMLNNYGVDYGDWEKSVSTIIRPLERMLRNFPSEVNIPGVRNSLEDFILRLKKGIIPEFLPLARIQGIGRKIIIGVYSRFGTSFETILNSDLKVIDGIAEITERKIKDGLLNTRKIQATDIQMWCSYLHQGRSAVFPVDEFRRIIADPESNFYEFKVMLDLGNTKHKFTFVKTFIAMSNVTDYLFRLFVFGIDDSGTIIGDDNFDSDRCNNIINQYVSGDPQYKISIQTVDGKRIPIIVIKPPTEVLSLKREMKKDRRSKYPEGTAWRRLEASNDLIDENGKDVIRRKKRFLGQ